MRLGIFILDSVWDSIGTAQHIRGDWILTKSTRTVVNVLVRARKVPASEPK